MTALLAGAIAGVCLFIAHLTITTPLVLQAEVYENATSDGQHADTDAQGGEAAQEHTPDVSSGFDMERTAFSLMADLLLSIGFSLLLVGAMALSGERLDWQRGLIWGLCGYAALSVAPAFGLPPELPGMMAADLQGRQAWWAATVLATVGGLALIFLADHKALKFVGPVLIILPHVVGAPRHQLAAGDVPAELAAEFAIATLVVSGLYWLLLGGLAGHLYQRFDQE